MRTVVVVLLVMLAVGAAEAKKKREWQPSKLTRILTEERVGPVRIYRDMFGRVLDETKIFTIRIYHFGALAAEADFAVPHLEAGNEVQIAIEGSRFYVKTKQGKEYRLKLVK